MNKQVKLDVLAFMRSVETKNMNTNTFVLDFFKFKFGDVKINEIKNWPSFESISRSRRYWLMIEKQGNLNLWLSRTEQSRDSQITYKEQFTRTPLWIY